MAWIESHQSLGNHRKLLTFIRILNISDVEAVGYLHYLWWWSLDNAPDGNLTGIPSDDIAMAGHWNQPGRGRKRNSWQFVSALINSHFIDINTELTPNSFELPPNSTLYLHDWDNYAGKLIDRRRANSERQKAFRNAHVTVMSQLRNVATVPNRTQPNRISKDIHSVITLPEWIKKETWDSFVDSRKKIKKPMTDNAKILLIEKLTKAKEQGFSPDELLKEAIMNGWQSIVVRPGGNNGHKSTGVNWANTTKNPITKTNARQLIERHSYTNPNDLRNPGTNQIEGNGGITPGYADN